MTSDMAKTGYDDTDDCPRCGNPLPVDRHCDCAGSELDSSLGKNRLKLKHQIFYRRYPPFYVER